MMASKDNCGKRHNPVDSLCRKLHAINTLDHASNPTLQIPKFQSKNFDSPQSNVRKNLEEILKRRTVKSSDGNSLLGSDPALLSPFSDSIFSPAPVTARTPRHRRVSDIRSESFSLSGNKEKASKSVVLVHHAGSGSPYLVKHGGPPSSPGTPPLEYNYFTSSPDLPRSAQPSSRTPSAKRFSLGWRLSSDNKDDRASDISLISEEDLLTTMFSACDVEKRGKIAVSKLVDFLRFTTSRSSEDSGLEELCNMLDPDRRDISMDLETYHAIMKEWIDDCKQSWNDLPTREISRESILAAKRMNVTSGSLEALGGDVSRGDLETSDLITCVADLQFNNHKLQEENAQLKSALDTLDDTNNRLTEDSEELRNQIKSFQQSAICVKTLKEELEEVKNTLNASEEKRQKMAAQNKQLEKENQLLVLKISSLQEENIRNALDLDGLQKKIEELSRNAAELQMQVHLCENMVGSKDAALLKKESDIQELTSTLMEYTSVIETLRIEKNKLVNNIQHMQQELISNGINFPLIYKFNSSFLEATNSLHCELELAQDPSEIPGIEWTALDESLDREVLLLLEGPERVGGNFKATIQNLQEELSQIEDLARMPLLKAVGSEPDLPEAYKKSLVALKESLENKRGLWLQKLRLLEAQKESLDKELVKMAGNMRRMRTEQLHLKKTLLSRQREIEATKQLKEDAVAEVDLLRVMLQEVTVELQEAGWRVKDRGADCHAAQGDAHPLEKKVEGSSAEQGTVRGVNTDLAHSCYLLELKAKEQRTALEPLREKYFKGLLCPVLCQSCANGDESPLCCSNINEEIRTEEKSTCCLQRLGAPWWCPWGVCWFTQHTLLLDALALDSLTLIPISSEPVGNSQISIAFGKQLLRIGRISSVMLDKRKCGYHSVGNQTNAELTLETRMDAVFPQVSGAGALADPLTSGLTPFQGTSFSATEEGQGSAEMDLTLQPPLSEGKAHFSTSLLEEATAVAEEEATEEILSGMAGDSSLCQDASCGVVCQKRQLDSVSPDEKEVEAEFLRLSLGFKCDLFTLEKRVRLEERSRDLAEGNLRKEIAGALKLLDSVASLSKDNQVQETAQKLRKSIELLNQQAMRIASKAEMLGAVHQECRVSKAVEVMIQHVENLKRTYTREHAELEELKEILLQSERSFGSLGDPDESSVRKLSGALKAQFNEMDGSNRNGKFNRRTSWSLKAMKEGEKRPSLQRFISSASWTESEEEKSELENSPVELPAPEIRGNKAQKPSDKETSTSKWGLRLLCLRLLSWASSRTTSFRRSSTALCISVMAAVFLAILLTFVTGSFQKAAEAVPDSVGSAWTTVQQLLWPHTHLLHQGPPPV